MLDRLNERRSDVARNLPDGLEIPLAYADTSPYYCYYWPGEGFDLNAPSMLRDLGIRRPQAQMMQLSRTCRIVSR
ncbi:MAG: hypothetical protein ACT4OM_13975 [Actinomycetota bacterium]